MSISSTPPPQQSVTSTVVPSTTTAKPFPFLRLPAELRNRVYDFAIEDTERKAMRQVPADPQNISQSNSFLGLTNAYRQTRAEFGPLFYQAWSPIFAFCLLVQLLTTFARNPSALTWLTVEVYEGDSNKDEWDILALLRARAHFRNTVWKFIQVSEDYHGATNSRTYKFLRATIALGKPGFLDICKHNGHWSTYDGEWRIIMQKEGGHLTAKEVNCTKSYCRTLGTSMPHDSYIYVPSIGMKTQSATVRVYLKDQNGKVVAQCVWDSKKQVMSGKLVHEKKKSQGGRAKQMRW